MRNLNSYFSQFSIYLQPRIYICSLLAFSSGFSVLFLMCTIPIWLKDFGIGKSTIGWYSLAYIPYVLKFLWAPFINSFSLPFFGRWLGHLRGWAFITQLIIIILVTLLSLINPMHNGVLTCTVVGAIAFFSASRDIVTDAYRVEILDKAEIAPGSAMYLLGYRIGMLTASAGSLLLADNFPWSLVFLILGFALFVGLIVILFLSEPDKKKIFQRHDIKYQHLKLKGIYKKALKSFEDSVKEFINRKSWLLIVVLIPIYKLGDNFVQNMSNIFFLEIGFSKTDIASTVKIFGLLASIAGSIWGGIIVNRIGDLQAMFVNGLIHLLAFSLFSIQAVVGDNLTFLYITIALTHITGGIVTTAFVSYLSHLCHPEYKVTQYALFSSLRSLDKCLTFPSGWLADHLNWMTYFLIVPLFGLPALVIIAYMLLQKHTIRVMLTRPILQAKE